MITAEEARRNAESCRNVVAKNWRLEEEEGEENYKNEESNVITADGRENKRRNCCHVRKGN